MVATIAETPAGLQIYLRGYHQARLVHLLTAETRVCIAATLMGGIVLALSAFNSSIHHRGGVHQGEVAERSEGEAENKEWRDASRAIVEAAEMATTGFVKVMVRSGEPGGERRYEKDEELQGGV
ncbi:hypothetical protein CspeluHIS016_0202970 [Cutaneotrichosporon spelunceum]|uniref:Uncharacterized protein n=1 Tax=Cutaneotrichosporon spelunceum TaxID=1672016 RepID=A0AAD3TQS0_9TREE|nr:hypothetical protein CspeluHIS016_0202970 [Cutaneotrichosporon spelunceum]